MEGSSDQLKNIVLTFHLVLNSSDFTGRSEFRVLLDDALNDLE